MVAVAETEKTEKITINLGLVDLGQVDLLVQEGFYANRTDCIRTAIRAQLATHAEAVHRTVARKTLVLGVQHLHMARPEAPATPSRASNPVPRPAIIAGTSPRLSLATIVSSIASALRPVPVKTPWPTARLTADPEGRAPARPLNDR